MVGVNDGPARRHRRSPAPAVLAAALLTLAGCADFTAEPARATVQASLSAAAMHPQDDRSFPIPTTAGTPTPTDPSAPPSETAPADPCRPADTTIIAACLEAPWGLAVLPDGVSALVGERTTGRILRVAPQAEPVEVARVSGLDSTGGGGLLGLALSPHYGEDGLIYAFVTTPTDNRIVRIAPGDVPKEIFAGIPRGTGPAGRQGGRITFGVDGFLYIATGDAGVTGAGQDPKSLAGKVLRLDEFGRPAPATGTPSAGDPAAAIYASGLADPSGICALGADGIAVVDRVGAADILAPVTAGVDLTTVPATWTFPVSDGGAVDCAADDSVLAATSLDQQLVTVLTRGTDGGFTGTPTRLATGVYGRLLSLDAGTQGVLWATTANRDGQGEPQPRDDLVVVIPTGGGSGGGGRD